MNNKYDDVPLSDRTKELILGSLLGDGSLKIHKNYRNARFSFRHSVTQEEYFYWKVENLREICSEKCIFEQENDGGFSRNNKLRFQSLAIEPLTALHDLTHKRGKLRIRRRWLNQMSALSLAIWWMDDGSIISNGRKGVFCTDGFEEKDVKILAQYLEVVWKIKTVVAPIQKRNGKKEEYFRLWIRSTEELKKFLRIILPHLKVPSMLSKAMLLYNDNQLQQRWISEVTEATGFSEQIVNDCLSAKRSKWKDFRK